MHWSPSSRTALAEAELEYPEGHRSTSVYVAMPLTAVGSNAQQQPGLAEALQVGREKGRTGTFGAGRLGHGRAMHTLYTAGDATGGTFICASSSYCEEHCAHLPKR